MLCGAVRRALRPCALLSRCVSGGVDPAAGGEEEDQEGLQAGPAPLPVQPRPQQCCPGQRLLQRCQVEQYVVHCECASYPGIWFTLPVYSNTMRSDKCPTCSQLSHGALRHFSSAHLRGGTDAAVCLHLLRLQVKGHWRLWRDRDGCKFSEGFMPLCGVFIAFFDLLWV